MSYPHIPHSITSCTHTYLHTYLLTPDLDNNGDQGHASMYLTSLTYSLTYTHIPTPLLPSSYINLLALLLYFTLYTQISN